jgi:hypothetical protein
MVNNYFSTSYIEQQLLAIDFFSDLPTYWLIAKPFAYKKGIYFKNLPKISLYPTAFLKIPVINRPLLKFV